MMSSFAQHPGVLRSRHPVIFHRLVRIAEIELDCFSPYDEKDPIKDTAAL